MKKLFNLKIKKLLFKLTVLISLLLLSSPAFATNWCDDANCQGCWLFSEGSGTTVADDSQNTNTGNFLGSGEPAWAAMSGTGAPSYADYMVTADSTDDSIISTSDSSLDITGDFSYVFWMNADGSGGNFSKRGAYQNGGFYAVENGGGERLDFHINSSGLRTIVTSSYHTYNTGDWSHFAVILDGAGAAYYIDGVDDISGSTNEYMGTYTSDFTLLQGGWGGSRSESAIFDKDLSGTDINDIMDNGLYEAATSTKTTFY